MQKEQSSAGRKEYTFDEFVQHFRALSVVRKYEHIGHPFGSPHQVEIGDDSSFEANAFRVMDYFHQIYPDTEEAREKSVLFLVMVTHLAKFHDSYDSEKFSVSDDTEQVALVSSPLLRAVHHHFTRCRLSELPREEEQLVESIKDEARRLWRDEKV